MWLFLYTNWCKKMKEAKWAELLAMLMKYTSEIFASLEGFKSGKLIVEADAEKQNLKITITKDAGERLDIDFKLIPKEEIKEKIEEEKPSIEEPKIETIEEAPEEKEEESLIEIF